MDSVNYLWPLHRNCGINNVPLKINECCLEIVSQFTSTVEFYARNSECLDCDFILEKPLIEPNQTSSYILNTEYPIEFYVENDKKKMCSNIFWFENIGKYSWNISKSLCRQIEILEPSEPFWINLGVILSVFIGLALAYALYRYVLNINCLRYVRRHVPYQELEADLGNPENRDSSKSYIQARTRRQTRIGSVDVFRGIAIAIMIFVNYGGGGYGVFKHAPWNGLTFADLVFPWFIWIMGVSIALSLRSNLRTSVSRKKIFCKIVRRTLLLIALGLILNSSKDKKLGKTDTFSSFRIPGVLQRIGITYFVVASTELIFIKPQRNEQIGPWYFCPDIVDSTIQWIIALMFVAVHELITFMLPVPGCPTGYLGPGGWHEHSAHENCTGGAAGYLDRLIFTDNHLYQHPTFQKIYHTHTPLDPEGFLGTLTSIFCAFLGVHVGRIILCYENTYSRLQRWLIWGIFLGGIAAYLSNISKNDGIVPINKNLWSISYVLATSSSAFIVFSCLYWLIDYRRIYNGFPFLYAGMNALALYVGHEVFKKYFPWYWRSLTETHCELLIMNLTATILWLYIAYVLYLRNIFITI